MGCPSRAKILRTKGVGTGVLERPFAVALPHHSGGSSPRKPMPSIPKPPSLCSEQEPRLVDSFTPVSLSQPEDCHPGLRMTATWEPVAGTAVSSNLA